jgi:hypothetical protein
MGDYADFCESYGGSANDPDFMDRWLDEYASGPAAIDRFISKAEEVDFKTEYELSNLEWDQVKKYVAIFNEQSLKKHHEVNEYIGTHGMWDQFSKIRSMNDHGNGKVVHGITPKHFKLVCEILKITGGDGDPLKHAERY